ncbi:MAG: hypothetical protein M1831_002121 [Alyxoria varia]|nr:MAG: hypothetical protein M1831_002121 [Alyxoria varia]
MTRVMANAAGESVLRSNREEKPELRLLHYNDVYHMDSSSREPVGGIARFQSICNYYRNDPAFKNQSKLVTFFSGDAFNPSLESAVTKGVRSTGLSELLRTSVLTPNVACVGNHDLDFGVPQFRHLAQQCEFPWLLANVLDPALGEDVSLGNAEKTKIIETSNGYKIGVIGLVEREWLDTVNSLPPNLEYRSASATAKELVPKLREDGADIIIAVTHAREPNDLKLAEKTPPGFIDIIMGGHDHFYQHKLVNGIHLLRSGTDFKQLSYVEAWRKKDGSKGWDFDITRRDVLRSVPEDPEAAALVEKLGSRLKDKLEKPIGYTSAALDARFQTVRQQESNYGNFVCDLMRLYYEADCTIMAAGTIRGDQVYPPGILRAKDIMNCFPFEDPVVVIKVNGKAIVDALENGVSLYPALEGRFPQVSNIHFTFDPNAEPGSRITKAAIGDDDPVIPDKPYVLATRDYMIRGKDGYTSLLSNTSGGHAEEVVSEENGILISMLLRQYFLSLKVLGKWDHWGKSMGRHFDTCVHSNMPVKEPTTTSSSGGDQKPASSQARQENGPTDEDIAESDDDDVIEGDVNEQISLKMSHTDSASSSHSRSKLEAQDRELGVMRRSFRKWARVAGLAGRITMQGGEEEFTPGWTKGITPKLEGRIKMVGC